MVGHQSNINNVSSDISMNHENYSSLLQAFKEIREETKQIGFAKQEIKRSKQLFGK